MDEEGRAMRRKEGRGGRSDEEKGGTWRKEERAGKSDEENEIMKKLRKMKNEKVV